MNFKRYILAIGNCAANARQARARAATLLVVHQPHIGAAPYVTGNESFAQRLAGIKIPRPQGPTTHDAHLDKRSDSARMERKKTAGDMASSRESKTRYILLLHDND